MASKDKMKEILLTQNKITLVDDEDYEWLSKHKWYADKIGNTYYAGRSIRVNGKKICVTMHREILGLKAKDGKIADHIDRNGLHNRKVNLRIVSQAINIHNGRFRTNNTSGYRGVVWERRREKWQAQLTINKKNIFCGYFPSAIEAAIARDNKATEYLGVNAILNFPKCVNHECTRRLA